ncbi:DUF1642 domain-containing protein [Lactococcus lactis]|uniref:DUF1642 domain-containing protein n=1 Tax=Lactococcus lactis TaxID=1358 RepID=A0A3S3LU69_9LACT|nr:DUF1642 domain-containing protein [Lactococcus lactis]NYZ59571.1 DUF1642 domain-containing protein [Lactococcus lactis]RWR45568.1 DUF1642 domain-containing protein [Lactococcus lactis]
MTKEMKRPTSHISQNSIKPALSKAVEFYTDNNRQAYECIRERDEYIDYLESQVSNAKQQQALPVVPECVGIWIKKCQELNWMITDVLAPESWSSDFAKDTENWLKKSKENFNLLALAFITGKYQVEKPQLFYLKNKITGAYLYYDEATKLYSDIVGNVEDFFGTKTKFTEAEIGSMETGSYELVPVEDGE